MLRKGQEAFRAVADYTTAPSESETKKLATITALATTWALWELCKDGLNLELVAPAAVLLVSGGSLVRKEGMANLTMKTFETAGSIYHSGVTLYNNWKNKAPAQAPTEAPTISKKSA